MKLFGRGKKNVRSKKKVLGNSRGQSRAVRKVQQVQPKKSDVVTKCGATGALHSAHSTKVESGKRARNMAILRLVDRMPR
jgi:hypothetical protein